MEKYKEAIKSLHSDLVSDEGFILWGCWLSKSIINYLSVFVVVFYLLN